MRLDRDARDTRPREARLLEALRAPSGYVLTVQIADRDDRKQIDTWELPLPASMIEPGMVSALGEWLGELASTLKHRAITAGQVSIHVVDTEVGEEEDDEDL